MTLLEIGVFKQSLLIFHRSFYPLKYAEKSLTAHRRSNIINLIGKMSEIVLDGEISMLDNNNYRIFFAKMPQKHIINGSFFVYAIGDKTSEIEIVNSLLRRLIAIFLHAENRGELNSAILEETSVYVHYNEMIDDVLADECLSPLDRVKQFLF